MTKQEIEKAIDNGESVWVANKYCLPYGVELTRNYYVDMVSDKEGLMLEHLDHVEFIDYLDCIFKTKAEAEHYLHHANISRTEQLPFITWEEFLEEKELFFTNKSGYPMCLRIVDTKLGKKIGLGGANGYFDLQQTWNLTEENFYKAYDECERLFKGRSDINEVEK